MTGMEAFYQQLNGFAPLSEAAPVTACLENPLPVSQQYTIRDNNWPLLVRLARLNLTEVDVLKSELSWYPWA
jgi:hypothetical protein